MLDNLEKIIGWLKKHPRPIWLKTIIIIFLILGWTEYQYKIIGKIASKIWEEKAVVSLILDYEVENSKGVRDVRIGGIIYSGDLVTLKFKTNTKSWITVVGIDVNGVYPIFPKKFGVAKIEKNGTYVERFRLDQTVGTEVYYAIASYDSFDFEKEVRPALEKTHKILSDSKAKGADFGAYHLKLSAKFSQDHRYFQHLDN